MALSCSEWMKRIKQTREESCLLIMSGETMLFADELYLFSPFLMMSYETRRVSQAKASSFCSWLWC